MLSRRLAVIVLCGGCRAVVEAPEDVNDGLHDLWRGYEGLEDEDVAVALHALPDLVDVDAIREAALDGYQTRLDAQAQGLVELYAPPGDAGTWTRPDPALARGLFVVTTFTCGMEALRSILQDLDQNAIYDSYDSYERRYTSDLGAWDDGAVDTLRWEVDASASNIATGSYTELLLGGLRRVPLGVAESTRLVGDHALLARTHIPYPADAERDNVSFNQDYQIEAYLPLADDEVLHFYGIWREMDLGSLGTMEGDGVARITLNNMASWDDKTEAACTER